MQLFWIKSHKSLRHNFASYCSLKLLWIEEIVLSVVLHIHDKSKYPQFRQYTFRSNWIIHTKYSQYSQIFYKSNSNSQYSEYAHSIHRINGVDIHNIHTFLQKSEAPPLRWNVIKNIALDQIPELCLLVFEFICCCSCD